MAFFRQAWSESIVLCGEHFHWKWKGYLRPLFEKKICLPQHCSWNKQCKLHLYYIYLFIYKIMQLKLCHQTRWSWVKKVAKAGHLTAKNDKLSRHLISLIPQNSLFYIHFQCSMHKSYFLTSVFWHAVLNEPQVQKVMLIGCDCWILIYLVCLACGKMDVITAIHLKWLLS